MIYVLAHTQQKAQKFILKHAEVPEAWVAVKDISSFREGEKGFILICAGQYWKNPLHDEVFNGAFPWFTEMRIFYGEELGNG